MKNTDNTANSGLVESFPLQETLEEIANQKVSAEKLVTKSFFTIKHKEDQLHAWVFLNETRALERAKWLDSQPVSERGPLHGLPVGIKDIIDVAGMPTKCGSSLRDETPAQTNASFVDLLESLGAVVLGKTVTTEFAYFNPGPTRNPHNVEHTPGGSSSGSAAAVAAGMVPLAVGTQTAASVTRPAAYCGVNSVVASVGLFDTSGVTGLSETFDTMGLIGSDAAGLQQVLAMLAAAAQRDGLKSPSTPQTLLVWHPGAEFGVDEQFPAAIRETLNGWDGTVEDISSASFDETAAELIRLHELIMAYDAAAERAEDAKHPQELSAPLNDLFATGQGITDAEYTAAQQKVAVIKTQILELLGENNVLITAAAQSYAPEGIQATGKPLMSRVWQAMGLPVVAHPGAKHPANNMPLGIQLVGAPRSDLSLLELSAQLAR